MSGLRRVAGGGLLAVLGLVAVGAAEEQVYRFGGDERTTAAATTEQWADGERVQVFSVPLAEGNWRVRFRVGHPTAASTTILGAETRRQLAPTVVCAAGEVKEIEAIVNVRTAELPSPPPNAPGGLRVRLNPRESEVRHWDEQLTLLFSGAQPAVQEVAISPAPDVPTVFLLGDSTVTDQPRAPAASWGQMLPQYLGPYFAVANHAESGETLKSFLTGLRLDKVLSLMRPGDYALIQFGHNDSKVQWPQTYAEAGTTYEAYLRVYVAEVRRRSGQPVLITSPHRRVFGPDGRIQNTHGEYPAAVQRVAAEMQVPVIDLAAASAQFYEALGPELSTRAFADHGRDQTHHHNYGADVLARVVASGLAVAYPEVGARMPPEFRTFDPSRPPLPPNRP